ncbi:MAG: hypothetical protein IAE78_12890 [Myxococcus sp.]|nr:hypothetical protein [Myxococcus sp.]
MKRLFDFDEERRFVADLRFLGRALVRIAEAPFGSRLRKTKRRALAQRLLKDNAMLELALQIALHTDEPDQEDYALVTELHNARLRRLAEEAESRRQLHREARRRASKSK